MGMTAASAARTLIVTVVARETAIICPSQKTPLEPDGRMRSSPS